MPAELPIGEALRALPLPSAPADGWMRLHATLARRRRRHVAGWLAVAASLAIATLLVVRPAPEPTAEVVVVAPAAIDGDALEIEIEALLARSAELESQLAWIEPGGRSADVVALDLALVERLQWLDRLLAEPAARPTTRELLWRERVRLLDQRLALAGDSALIAAASAPSAFTL